MLTLLVFTAAGGFERPICYENMFGIKKQSFLLYDVILWILI